MHHNSLTALLVKSAFCDTQIKWEQFAFKATKGFLVSSFKVELYQLTHAIIMHVTIFQVQFMS